MALTFRKATVEDVAKIVSVHRSAAIEKHPSLANKFNFTEQNLARRLTARIEHLEDAEKFITVVEDEEGLIVGFIEGGFPRNKRRNKGIFKNFKGLIRRKYVSPEAELEDKSALEEQLQAKGKEELAARGIDTALFFVPKDKDLTEEEISNYGLEKLREVRIRRGMLRGTTFVVYSIQDIQ